MKKGLKVLLLIICLFPILINAATFKPSMSCPSTANPGDTVSCKITATIDKDITGVEGKFNLGGTTYVGFTENSKVTYFVSPSADTLGFTIGEVNGIQAKINSTSLDIGTLKVKIPNNNLTAFSIQVTDVLASVKDNDNGISSSNLVQTIKIKSSDSSLKSLSVEGMTLGPNFRSTTYEYALPETDAKSIKINATPNDDKATVSGAGTVNLKYGDNTITVTVTSESGSTTKYKIKVHKTDTRDTVNTLSALGVKGYSISPTFSSSTREYTLTVDENVSKVEITATLTSDKSSFIKSYGPRSVSLSPGSNKELIKVKSENEKENTYSIVITRKDNRDSNNYLSSLKLSDGNISFNKETTSYTVNVSENLTEITISAIAESSKAKVKGSGTVTLNEGKNEIVIEVTAENTSVRKYTLIVNRGEVQENPVVNPSNNYVKSLIIRNAEINFDPKTYQYNVTIKSTEDKLDILYQVEDGYDNTIEGNENLKTGSVVKLIVGSGEDKVEYVFNITKEGDTPVEDNKNNLIFYIAVGFLGLVVFGILLSIITRKKPTPEEVVKNKYVQEEPRKFYNTPTYVDGLSGSEVSGSMIRQIERPNSMSDTVINQQPQPVIEEPEVVTQPELVSFEEPAPVENPQPVVFEDLTPVGEPTPVENPEPQPFEMMELSETNNTSNISEPEFAPITEEDINNHYNNQ